MINNNGYVLENFKYYEIEKIINNLLKEKDLKKIKFNSSLHIKKNYNENIIVKKYKNFLSV